MTDIGYEADLAFCMAILDVHTEIVDRRHGDAEAIRRLEALMKSLEELEPAPKLRARLRSEIPEIIEALRALGPIALAPST